MPSERILHFSHTDIDDPRIVNAAQTGLRNGYSVFFCGSNNGTALHGAKELFEQVRSIEFGPKARVASTLMPVLDSLWKWYPYPQESKSLDSQFQNVLHEVRPDIIHAHDLFAAYYAVRSGVATIFDDHELYSLEARAMLESIPLFRISRRSREWVKKNKWSKWERYLEERTPILTVSKGIADHHKHYCSHVFNVPNFPSSNSILGNQTFDLHTEGELNSVYLGRDQVGMTDPFRNIAGLHEIFAPNTHVGKLIRIGVDSPNNDKIKSVGRLAMEDAYAMMQKKCHIGLLPWRKHWFHRYANPNKVYEYAHCGLWLASIDDIPSISQDFEGLCDLFSDYGHLSAILEYYNANPAELNKNRSRIFKHAKENLIWEKNESKILSAYKLA